MNKQYANRKKGVKRFFTFSTRLNYKERNSFLKSCRNIGLTPSEMIRMLIIKYIREAEI